MILALVGTALFRLFSGALGNASAADDCSRAVLVAESVLAEAASTQPLRETTQQGTVDDGRIEWTTKVAPYYGAGRQPGHRARIRVDADAPFSGERRSRVSVGERRQADARARDDAHRGERHRDEVCAPTLAASLNNSAAALPPEGEQFAPWGGPAAW